MARVGGTYSTLGQVDSLEGSQGGSDTAVVDASALTAAHFSGGLGAGQLYDSQYGTTINLKNFAGLDFTGNADGITFAGGVSGGTGDDKLTGLGGNDTFTGDGGNDQIDGGGGTNTASLDYSDRTGNLVLLNGGVADVTYTATVGGVAAGSVRNIQALSVTGGSGDDAMGGAYTSYSTTSTLDGGGGTNTLVVDASALTAAHFSGGLGAGQLYDSQYGTTINLKNFAGLDFTGNADGITFAGGVSGGTGDDKLTGLGGNDTFTGDGGNDQIDGGGGTNTASLDYSDRTGNLVLLNGGVADVTYTATVGGVAAGSVRNIQALSVTGGSGDDAMGGAYTSYSTTSTLDGGGGTNTLVVDASALTAAHFSGGLGAGQLYDSQYGTTINLKNFAGLDFTGNADGITFAGGVSGGTGDDKLTGLGGNDTFTGDGGNDQIDGGGGTNTASLDYSDRTGNLVLLNGGVADVTYTATVGGVAAGSVRNIQALSVTGGSGDDAMGGAYTSYSTTSTLDGGGGTNTLVVDASALTAAHFSGGLGAGQLYDSQYGTTINLKNFAGLDFTGNADGITFAGGVSGGTGDDKLTGLGGNDTFTGDGGNDQIDGGGGTNTASLDYSDRTGNLVLLNGGVADVTYTATVGGVAAGSVRNIQALSVTGGSGDDAMGGAYTSYSTTSTLDGGGGTNTLVVDASALTAAHFSGGLGAGQLYDSQYGTTINLKNFAGLDFTGNADGITFAGGVSGGTGDDKLTGLGGNDTFTGDGGNDQIDGGGGTNTASLDYSDRTGNLVLLNGGAANTTYQATVDGVAAGSVRNIQALSVTGGSGDDTMGGAYTSYGTTSTLDGGGGTNTLVVDASSLTNAQFSGGLGAGELYDSQYGTTINLKNFAGLDFTGNANSAYFSGGVSGGTGDDILVGLGGDDTFTGNGGNDQIDGGGGTNTAIFAGNRSDYAVSETGGVTTVRDLRPGSPSGTDTLTHIQNLQFDDQTVGSNGQPTGGPSAPTANGDTYTVLLGDTLTVSAADGVLKNDTDPEAGTLTATVVQAPSHGSLSFNQDGSFTYAPDAGYIGSDTFAYTATDAGLTSAPATVTTSTVPATVTLDPPSALAPGEVGTATVHYTASSSAPAALLLVQTVGALVADPLTGAYSDSALVFVPANLPDGKADISLSVKMAASQGLPSNISVALADSTATIDWAAQKADLKPASVSDAVWDREFANFTAAVGSTVGSLTSGLAADATLLRSFGISTQSASAALAFEIEQAGDFGTLAAHAATGSMGQGWATIADVGLSIASDGSVTLKGATDLAGLFTFDAADAGRYTLSSSVGRSVDLSGSVTNTAPAEASIFSLQPDGSFATSSGRTLTRTGAGVVLTEVDGSTLRFDASGKFLDAHSASGTTATASYDGSGHIVSLMGANRSALTFTRDAGGLITGIADSEGTSLSLSYAGTTLASSSSTSGTTGFAYDGAGDLSTVDRPATAPSTAFSYDANGRLNGIDTGSGSQTETYSYDDVGGVTVTDGAGVSTKVALLPGGSEGRVTDALGNTSSLLYNAAGQLIGTEDANGTQQTVVFDSSGRVTAVTDGNGATVHYGYLGASTQPVSFTDANGSTRSFTYDGTGRVVGATWPDGTTLAFGYDAAGNLTSYTDRRGDTITYTYDAAGNETSASDSPAGVVTYAYDASGPLVSATSAAGATTLGYDAAGRINKIVYPDGHSLAYIYDAAGRRTSMTDQDGHAQIYTYDSAGRLITLGTESGTLVTYAYDSAGNLVRQSDANGTATSYTYDNVGRLITLANLATDGSTSSFETYGYDATSRRVSMTSQDGHWAYGYDTEGQLTSADFRSSKPGLDDRYLVYTYDAAGNRVSSEEDGVTLNYEVNSLNQYTKVGDASFTYDASGNMASRTDSTGTTTYSYDSGNRLKSITSPSGVITSYEYDVFGHRAAKSVGGVETSYLVDPFGQGNLIDEYNGSGVLQASYEQGLGTAAKSDDDGSLYFYQLDGVGSVSSITNQAGVVESSFAYEPFGGVFASSGDASDDFGFNGGLGISRDSDTLLDFRARDYDTQLGRFVSEDSGGNLADVANLYRFVNNSPVSGVDPTGEFFAAAATVVGVLSLAYWYYETRERYNYVYNQEYNFDLSTDEGMKRYSQIKNKDPAQAAAQAESSASIVIGSGISRVNDDAGKLFDVGSAANDVADHFLNLSGTQGEGKTKGLSPGLVNPPASAAQPLSQGSVPVGRSDGDPHLQTFDNLAYDFQAVGEFQLVRETSGPFEVQARQSQVSGTQVAINTAVAARIGSDVVEIDSAGASRLLVDGKQYNLAQGETIAVGDGAVYRSVSGFTATYTVVDGHGNGFWVNIYAGADHLRPFISSSLAGKVTGLLGNDNGDSTDDIALRDGTVLSQPVVDSDLYGKYADSWRITDSTSLFTYGPGESTEMFTDRSFPSKVVTVDDLAPAARAAGEAAALAAGLTPGTVAFDNAVLDVGLTGNPVFAQGEAAAPQPTEQPDVLDVDRSPVFASAASVITGGGLASNPVSILANDPDNDPITYSVKDGGAPSKGTITFDQQAGTLTFTPNAGASGPDTVTIVASDGRGATVEEVLPIAIVTEGLVDDTGASASDGVTSDAALNGGGAAGATVRFTIDGVDGGASTTADAAGNWTFTPTGLADRVHQIIASETDANGHTGAVTLTFTLDTTGPSVTASAMSATIESTSSAGAVVPFMSSAIDGLDGTEAVTFTEHFDGGLTKLVQSGDSFSSGKHTVVASARDAAGNMGSSAPFTFTVADTTPPVVTASTAKTSVEATSAAGAAVTFSGSAVDTVDGTDPVTFAEQLAGGETRVVHSGDTFSVGEHTIIGSAVDTGGNVGYSAPFNFTVTEFTPAVSPTISGLKATQSTVSEAPIRLFHGVTVGDTNSGSPTETLTITQTGPGSLAGYGLLAGQNGTYRLIGSAASVTTQLDALVFTPAASAPRISTTTTFTLSDTSSASSTAATAAVSVTDLNEAVADVITASVVAPTSVSDPSSTRTASGSFGFTHPVGSGTDSMSVSFDASKSSTAAAVGFVVPVVTAEPVNGTPGQIGWTYKVADSQIAKLTAGQTLTEVFDVTVDDHHGTKTMQAITVTLTGSKAAATPVITGHIVSDTGSSATDRITNTAALTGTGDAFTTVHFTTDGKAVTDTAEADGNGIWTYTPAGLKNGSHVVVASETNTAGTGQGTFIFTLDTTPPVPTLSGASLKGAQTTLSGTVSPNSTVTVADGNTVLGTAKAGADGSWSLASQLSSAPIHSFTTTATDLAGNTGSSAGPTLYAPAGNVTLRGGTGNDILIGRPGDTLTGGPGQDTFVFTPSFGQETVTDFTPAILGPQNTIATPGDVLQIAHTLFSDFQSVMAHAQQVGANTLITADPMNTITLKNTQITSLHAQDFHFV